MRTVEDTLAISIGPLQPFIKAVHRTGKPSRGKLYLTLDGEPTSHVVQATIRQRDEGMAMRLVYAIADHRDRRFDYWIDLIGTPSNLNPETIARWHFVCWDCEGRTTTLYLPPTGSFFACRRCHRLTYRSRQEAHKYDKLIEISARELGLDQEQTRKNVHGLLQGRRLW
jgi:hypothetical protein